MKAKLVGVHKVRRKLANGETRIHYYAWRGGPRIEARPDTNEFLAEYLRLTRHRAAAVIPGTFSEVLADYQASPAYESLSKHTRRSYAPILAAIRQEYGELPIELLERTGMRRDFLKWRDTMADRPRTADMHISVLKRVLSWAVDREIITVNKLAGADRLHSGTRRDMIWREPQMAALLAVASLGIALAFQLAIATGQRQGDLLRLKWSAYDAGTLRIRQSKTAAMVNIRLAAHVSAAIDALPRNAVTILTNSRGRPWTSDGFRASWATTLAKAGITGLTFHDTRGTFITLRYHDGWSIKQISEVSGHSEKECETVVRKNYLVVDLGNGTGTER